jgi:hypothetical protein
MDKLEFVLTRFNYDPETGGLTWRDGKYAGQKVATKLQFGYLVVTPKIGGKRCRLRAHRVAFVLMTGHWPPYDIDHLNGIRDDNRWTNLRAATRSENKQNLGGPQRNGSSGFLGVSPHGKRWQAHIKINGRQTALGNFTTKEEAYQAYLAAKTVAHPFGERI